MNLNDGRDDDYTNVCANCGDEIDYSGLCESCEAELDTAPAKVAEKLRTEYEAHQQHAKEDEFPPMRSYVDFLETRIDEIVKHADDSMDEKDAEISRLRTALQPFAELWRHFGDESAADFAFTVRVRHSWLKAAVDALKEVEL